VEYLQESGVSIHRRRRRQRAAITLTVVTLLLLATFVYAAFLVQGWVATTAPKTVAGAACRRTASARPVTATVVTINVYNATSRDGLAASVAKLLQGQGFKIATVSNDPLGMSIQGVGEIRRGQSGAGGAILVATRLSGARIVPDQRTDATVDLVLGDKFTTLSTPPKDARTNAAKPTPSC
jgi:LytR cell envelope-related transcriptional attenuator